MELLLILTYVSICYVIFKLFRIPVNQWSLATATLGGIVGVFLLLLLMSYNHPFSSNARIHFAVTPIIPTVRGRVIEVPVESNAPLNQGDVLFKIDPQPYQFVVNQKQAMLAEAKQNVKQLKAELDQASAEAQKTKAQLELAQQTFERQAELFEKKVVAQAALDIATRNVDSARQAYASAQAAEERARLAFTSDIAGVNTNVARLQADLADAEYDLGQTIVRAPTSGFVTQVGLRPGMYTVSMPLRPVMVFVHDNPGDKVLAAAFQQNALQRVKSGDDAEVLFEAVPGRVFKATVRNVLDAIAAGQLQATGTMQDFGERLPGGRAVAILELVDDISPYQIPLGASGEAAIYTHHVHHLSLLRKILLRMRSWQNYVFLEH